MASSAKWKAPGADHPEMDGDQPRHTLLSSLCAGRGRAVLAARDPRLAMRLTIGVATTVPSVHAAGASPDHARLDRSDQPSRQVEQLVPREVCDQRKGKLVGTPECAVKT